ncbi:MAG TPA: TonB family protein [Pseudolabrys sp.]|jgi:protein TonB
MNAARDIAVVRCWPETLRWGLCFSLALGIHAAGAAALLAHWNEDADLVANAPVVMIELAALPVAPDLTPTEAPPDTTLSKEAEPEPEPLKPVKKVEIPLAPKAEMELVSPPKPPEKKIEKKPKQKQVSLDSAPSTAEQKAERAAAPSPGASSHNPDALPNWKSELVARLERAKRYPSEAQARGEQGVAQLAFSVDRRGGVHNVHIAHSSGSSSLDSATLELVDRAAPLPPPPPEVAGAQIAISVPIRYNIRR